MNNLFKVAQQFEANLRSYWVGKMQQSLGSLHSELVRWKVHPKLLEALKNLSKNGDPDGLWGKKTNRAIYFFNLAVDWIKKNPDFSEHFASAEFAKKGTINPKTGYVSNNALAKDNTRIINLFRNLLSQIDPKE